jgi:hypothetical protein
MDRELQALEARLARGAVMLDKLERNGIGGPRYERLLRQWLELLAVYELKSEDSAAASASSERVAVAGF